MAGEGCNAGGWCGKTKEQTPKGTEPSADRVGADVTVGKGKIPLNKRATKDGTAKEWRCFLNATFRARGACFHGPGAGCV